MNDTTGNPLEEILNRLRLTALRERLDNLLDEAAKREMNLRAPNKTGGSLKLNAIILAGSKDEPRGLSNRKEADTGRVVGADCSATP